jgi:hypothetical protein
MALPQLAPTHGKLGSAVTETVITTGNAANLTVLRIRPVGFPCPCHHGFGCFGVAYGTEKKVTQVIKARAKKAGYFSAPSAFLPNLISSHSEFPKRPVRSLPERGRRASVNKSRTVSAPRLSANHEATH